VGGRLISTRAPDLRQRDDHYEWISGYLQARGYAKNTRILMAVVSSSLAFTAVGAVYGTWVHRGLGLALGAVATVASIAFTAMWLRGWPSRRQSLTFALAGNSFIGAAALLQAEPLLAFVATTGMAVAGGYLAFFHTTRFILLNVALAIAVGAASAVQMSLKGEMFVAIVGFWLLMELNLGVPLAIHTVIRTLGADVVRSDHDPLTGLLTRRAFYERLYSLLEAPDRGGNSFLVFVMIDLDDFKRLNDTYGHAAGDQALAAVGWSLRQHSPRTATIGRSGGEEFVVADLLNTTDVGDMADRLCAAIRAVPHPVTGSVGTALIAMRDIGDLRAAIDGLMRSADAAMYVAKRRGGNQVQHSAASQA
jgi:diguanylate cyclase